MYSSDDYYSECYRKVSNGILISFVFTVINAQT